MLGETPKNKQIKTNKEAFKKNGSEDVDQEFIPLHVFARDFLGGQTYALELAYAVEGTGAEQTIYDDRFLGFCRDLRGRFLTSDIHAMSRYAANQAEIYSAKGDRLNTALAAKSLYQNFPSAETVASREADFLLEAKRLAELFPDTFEITEYDVDGKGIRKMPCVKMLDRILPFTATFGYTVNQIDGIIKKYGDRARAASADTVDWKATMHAVRIINEGISLLQGTGLEFPYSEGLAEALRRIRRGEVPYEDVLWMISVSLDTLKSLAETSSLPRMTQELKRELDVWLLNYLRVFYEII